MPDLDPGAIVRILNRHGLRYIIIGGIAAQLHDLPVPATVDIDVTPARDRTNLERLAPAFDELEAGVYTAEEAGTWFPRTPVERPKGAVFTQDALTSTAINSNNAWNMRGRDNVLTYLPMFHVGGLLIHTLPALHIGSCVTIHEEFDPTSVLAEIGTNGVSLILAPPTFSKALTSHPDWASTDLTGLRCVGIGSTFVPSEVMQPWFDLNVPTQQNYGLTEGVPILATPWEHARRKSRSAGTSMLYTQARVMDDRLDRVAPGMNGEIMLRGRSLFSGYWNNPEATEVAFVDGWFRTGDVGHTDEEGYFYIIDRIKNIVIVGSSNVYPADLEKVLDDCPEIAESAVVGCPDPDTGEALVACVKPRQPGGLSEQEVRSLLVGRPRRVSAPQACAVHRRIPAHIPRQGPKNRVESPRARHPRTRAQWTGALNTAAGATRRAP